MDWETILSYTFLVQVLSAGVRLGIPLIASAVGEVYAERSGVFNLGIEGIMLLGGFSGFAVAFLYDSLWMGVLAGLLVGALIGLIFSIWVVTLQSDQIVTGFSMLILCNGFAIFLYRTVFPPTSQLVYPHIQRPAPIAIPFLSKIPLVGPVLFNQDVIVYLVFLLAIASIFIHYYTRFGLRITAVGEYPAAADAVGINVISIRYTSTMIGGALAGLGGAYFSLVGLGFYSDAMIAGRGFVALALVIFGRWNPLGILLGGLLFGSFDALQLRLQILKVPIPSQFLIMLPYVLTILMLLLAKVKLQPSALTKPYIRE